MKKDNNGIIIGDESLSLGAEFHQVRGKSALLRGLVKDDTHQINWETPYYNDFINESLKGINLSDKICLDLGCSDGRFTEFLINKGVKKVICVDADYNPLLSLLKYSEEKKFREKIELIHGGIEKLPLEDKTIDIALALGVFYYLGEDQKKVFMNLIKN